MAKYAFIICTQNNILKEETNKWISNLFPKNTQIIFQEGYDSIFKAYNDGISQLEIDVDFCCFCHEDINVESINLRSLEKKLKDSKIGFIGVAGAKKLSASGMWWEGYSGKPHPNLSGKAGHQKIENNQLKRWINNYGSIGPVQVLDGVILFCRKDLLYKIEWDSNYFSGWDFYDISITWLANHLGYKNITFSGIELYHWGLGHMRDDYDNVRQKFLKWICTLLLR